MKKSFKKIVIPALTAIAFGAMSIGTTFALFTDEAKTNVEIQAGQVKIASNVSAATLKAFSMDPEDNTGEVERNDGTFYNGGSYALNNSVLTLNNITPGDRVEFKIASSNQSNVAIKYRFGMLSSGDAALLNALEVKINGDAMPVYSRSNWVLLAANAQLPAAQQEMTVVVSLPKEAGNECQNKQASLAFEFEAVQGNAEVKNDVEIDGDNVTVTSINGWNMLANRINSGDADLLESNITLDCDLDFNNQLFNEIGTKTHPFKGSFDGNGKTIKNARKDYADYVEDESYAGIIGYFNHTDSTVTGEIKNLKAENITFTNAFYAAGIVGYYWSNKGNLHDCEAKNVTITAIRNGGGVMGGGWSHEVYNCKAENVDITLTPQWLGTEYDDGNDAGGLIGGIPDQGDTKIIRNNTVKNVTIKAYRNVGAIIGKTYADNLQFKDNVVEGVMNFTIDQQTGWYGNKAVEVDFPGREDHENALLGVGVLLGSATSSTDVANATNNTTEWNKTIILHA